MCSTTSLSPLEGAAERACAVGEQQVAPARRARIQARRVQLYRARQVAIARLRVPRQPQLRGLPPAVAYSKDKGFVFYASTSTTFLSSQASQAS